MSERYPGPICACTYWSDADEAELRQDDDLDLGPTNGRMDPARRADAAGDPGSTNHRGGGSHWTDRHPATLPPRCRSASAEREQLNLLWKLAEMTQHTELAPGAPEAAGDAASRRMGTSSASARRGALREQRPWTARPARPASMRSQIACAGTRLEEERSTEARCSTASAATGAARAP